MEANPLITVSYDLDSLPIFCASVRVMGLSSDFIELSFIASTYVLIV